LPKDDPMKPLRELNDSLGGFLFILNSYYPTDLHLT
jgi:hypothetical protein